jgi:dolichol-phosphate mannosyltransferase
MSIIEPDSLLSVPTGALQIPELPPSTVDAGSENILLSLVIPTYKERDNIKNVVRILSLLLDESIPGNYKLIVVDDDSPDRTWEVAESLRREYRQLRVMRRQNERGLSSAVIRGWQAARGRVLKVIDGDLQHPLEVLTQLLRAIQSLTNIEYARLMGFLDDWCRIARIYDQYALFGNAIVPACVEWVCQRIGKRNFEFSKSGWQQLSLAI